MLPVYCFLGTVFTAVLLGHTSGYEPEEIECPEDVEKDFFFAHPWIPPGTPSRALLSLPPTFELNISAIPGRGIGVFSKVFIPKHTWLSEYEGEYVPIEESEEREIYDFAWRVRRDGYDDRLIDGLDESLANWLRYINCGRHVTEENVDMTMCYGHVYFKTTRDIAPGTELLMYCGDEYSQASLGITRDSYFDEAKKS